MLLNDRIRQILKSMGWQDYEFGEKLGLEKATVSCRKRKR